MESITREALLEKFLNHETDDLKGRRFRMTRVRVPGKQINFAHIICPSERRIYENLALHIGVHEGEDHMGETIGILSVTPWEAVIIAADIAVKSGKVEVGFMDRFCGTLILLGQLSEVQAAMEGVVAYFREVLNFSVRDIHKS